MSRPCESYVIPNRRIDLLISFLCTGAVAHLLKCTKTFIVFFTMSPSRWLLFALALHAALCGAMFSKRKRINGFETNDGSRMRRRIEDMFLRNAISGEEAQNLLLDGARDGLPRAHELKYLAGGGKNKIARNLRRRIMKPHKAYWPAPYVASIRVWDRKKGCEVRKPLPILLPHEIVGSLLRFNSIETLTQQTWMDPTTSSHLEKAKSELGLATAQPILGLGLWMDGVPCNWDRTDSLEVFSLNLPGISRSHSRSAFFTFLLLLKGSFFFNRHLKFSLCKEICGSR